jgi:signal transduction histidine kinase
MKPRLSMTTRSFLLAFPPMCLMLAAVFFAINGQVKNKVRDGLKDSLNRAGNILSDASSEYNRRYTVLAVVLGKPENQNALRQIFREASARPQERSRIYREIRGELSELNAALDYDFLGISDNRGRGIDDCFKKDEEEGGGLVCFDSQTSLLSRPPFCFNCHITPATNVVQMEDTLYNIAYVPVREGDEILGSLAVGTRMGLRSLGNFIHTAAVNFGGKVILTTFSPDQVGEIESQFKTSCFEHDIDGCEIKIDGKSYLALQPEGVSLPGDAVLYTFQSVDAAANMFMGGFAKIFLLTGLAGGLILLLLSAAASRSISKPVTDLVSHLKESERTGKLQTDFATDSGVKEVNLLAAALNRAGEAIRRSRRELEALAGRLISAKEEENKRLAREMHDVFSQKLAVLGMEVSALQQQLASISPPFSGKLRALGEEIGRLAKNVHQFSRQLHPSILDDLGLSATLGAECKAFSQQHGIAAKFLPTNVPDSLPGKISLSLYRIAQESLWNAAKYSQAREIRLIVSVVDSELLLAVEDDGKGFDPDRIKGGGGLGLVSMEERARLVGGSFLLESRPGKGTRVEVRVPLPHTEG